MEGSSFGLGIDESFNGTFDASQKADLNSPELSPDERNESIQLNQVEEMEAMNRLQERKLMYVADLRGKAEAEGSPSNSMITSRSITSSKSFTYHIHNPKYLSQS
jgi:hypothetical protein